jgi:hypothetical protein
VEGGGDGAATGRQGVLHVEEVDDDGHAFEDEADEQDMVLGGEGARLGAKGGAGFEHGHQTAYGRTGHEDRGVEIAALSLPGGVTAGMASGALLRFFGHGGISPFECLDLQIWKTVHFPDYIIAQMFDFDNHQFRNLENWKRFSRFLRSRPALDNRM